MMFVEYSDAIADTMLNAPRSAVLRAGGVAFGSTDRMSKRCAACGESKPLDAFLRDARKPDGRRYRCRDCSRIDARIHSQRYRSEHRDEVRESMRHRNRLRMGTAYYIERAKTDKALARAAVRAAVKDGRLQKPDVCSECGAKALLHGHHHVGYDRPLDVQWLCSICHGKVHRLSAVAA